MAAAKQARYFYPIMSCVVALIALVGFSKRYLLPLSTGSFHAPAIVQLHGVLTFAWIALLIFQTGLVASGRIRAHRAMGLAGIALGSLVVFTAFEVAVLLVAREVREGGPPNLIPFAADLFSWAVMTAGLFGTAVAFVDRPEVHKRLILLTALVMLNAAWARIIQLLDGDLSRLQRNDLAALPCDALIVIALVYDWRRRGSPHPANIAGASAIISVQLLTLGLRGSPQWTAIANGLASLAT